VASDPQPTGPASQFWRTEIFKLLRAAGLKAREAVLLSELLELTAKEQAMQALSNPITRLEARFDNANVQQRAFETKFDAKNDAQFNALRESIASVEKSTTSQIQALRWLVGTGVAVGALILGAVTWLIASPDIGL